MTKILLLASTITYAFVIGFVGFFINPLAACLIGALSIGFYIFCKKVALYAFFWENQNGVVHEKTKNN